MCQRPKGRKIMKKIIGIITAIIFAVILISCQDEITHQNFYEKIAINYQSGDNKDSVTGDIEFIYEENKAVSVSFQSSNSAILINDKRGIVNRNDVDTYVDITISITINDKKEDFIITLKVLKKEPMKTLIIDINDFTHVIGEEVFDYKNNFTATLNGVDVKHLVTVDDSEVNLEIAGIYNIKYKFTLDEDVVVKTIKLTVVYDRTPPAIIGVEDFVHIIGEDAPNYLEGVTAIDNVDGEVSVVVDDSLVNLDEVGSYLIYFIAVDKAGNETKIEKEVNVIKQRDITPPVINGTKDFNYIIGEDEPNYLNGVTAIDDVDGEVQVEVFANLVNLTKEGTYTIFFIATDSSGNRTTIEKEVVVTKQVDITPPVINGAKDFIHIVGNETPNYLNGVTAVDDVDGIVAVTIDDSAVDLLVEGIYPIIFVAVDLSDNETTIERKITVVDSGVIAETIVETFDNLGIESSGYSSDSFIGINGIAWTYIGSRSDLQIDGRALTFGSNNSAKLSATLDKGLSYFSLDAKTEFSGSETRDIALYINNLEVAVFAVTSEVQTFVVANLNYQESILLEVRNVAGQRVTIDNITLALDTKSAEEKLIEIVANTLFIPTTFIMEGEIEFPSEREGVNIAWNYEDSSDINNQYINLLTGLVTIPEGDVIVSVNLKATLTYSDYEREKIFILKIGEGEPLTIQAVRATSNGSQVKTKGIITSSVLKDNIYYAFMQDNYNGIYLESTVELIVGNEIVIKGVKQIVNGVVTLILIDDVKVKDTKTFNIAIINLNELNNYLGRFVEVAGYLTKNTTTNQTEYELTTLDGTVKVQLPSYIDQTILQSLLNGKEAGLKVTLEGYVYTKDVIYLISDEGLYIDDVLDNEAVSGIILAGLDLPTNNEEILDDIVLPITDIKFNSTIEWLSSNQSVLSDTGKVTIPSDNTTITLYYEIKIATKTIKSDSITVIVLANTPLLPYYQSVAGKAGNSLFLGLRNIISSRNITSYDKAKEILENSDRDPNNHNNVLLIYNRASVQGPWSNGGTIWNREHVWPQSFLSGNQYQDPHNLRPANPGVNSSRGNDKFARGSGSYGRVSGGWYPGDEDRGDVARIMFYLITLYSNLTISTMGSMEMFIEWHNLDPVDDFERNRNDVIYSYTNNRNPFIDHPHFVSIIWESTTYSTQKEEYEYVRPDVVITNNIHYDRREYYN